MRIRLAVSSDHGGFELKQALIKELAGSDAEVTDLGVHSAASVDYPDQAHAMASTLIEGKADLGLLVCGTGIGMSIAANRHPGIRAALCTDPYMARMSREHNDANILCLGGRVVGLSLALDITNAFLSGRFEGGRHSRRLEKIELT